MNAIYAAFFEFDGFVHIKVGRSITPYKRVLAISQGCPFELSKAAFCYVGSQAVAMSIESHVLERLSAYRTRGEWYRFRLDDGKLFSEQMKLAFTKVTGRQIKWTSLDVEAIRAEMFEAYKVFRGGRGKLSKAA